MSHCDDSAGLKVLGHTRPEIVKPVPAAGEARHAPVNELRLRRGVAQGVDLGVADLRRAEPPAEVAMISRAPVRVRRCSPSSARKACRASLSRKARSASTFPVVSAQMQSMPVTRPASSRTGV